MNKITKLALSGVIVGFLGFNTVQAAGSSIVQLHSKNLEPVGKIITASSEIDHVAQNYGKIDFDSYAMESDWAWDTEIAKVRMYDNDEYEKTSKTGSGEFYTKAKWTGESGAAYMSGYSAVFGN